MKEQLRKSRFGVKRMKINVYWGRYLFLVKGQNWTFLTLKLFFSLPYSQWIVILFQKYTETIYLFTIFYNNCIRNARKTAHVFSLLSSKIKCHNHFEKQSFNLFFYNFFLIEGQKWLNWSRSCSHYWLLWYFDFCRCKRWQVNIVYTNSDRYILHVCLIII